MIIYPESFKGHAQKTSKLNQEIIPGESDAEVSSSQVKKLWKKVSCKQGQ